MGSAQNVTIGVQRFGSTIHSMIQTNIEENEEALDENIHQAAEHAAKELQATSGSHDSWRGKGSMVKEKGAYQSGWHAYHHKRALKYHRAVSVVAQAHYPTLTHLLEEGHELIYFGTPKGYRIPGDHAIATAYENAAPIAQGGKVT